MNDEHGSNRGNVAGENASSGQQATGRSRRFERFGLIAVIGCAAGSRLWGLNQNGYGNSYYAAAVRSMLQNRANFFFGSFDPAGFVTIDKPPVAVWIQAVSAALFGYSGLSLLIPQALMGVASVGVLYRMVRRVAGIKAGLLAGLNLALTPISVAVDRDNLPDTALVLVLLLAAWSLSLAVETGRLRPLLVTAALVGVGFNVKMLAAFIVLPTFYLVYLVGAPGRLWSRLGRLTIATGVLVIVSLSWAVVVELTPKDRRPYIGGSSNNSAIELALGYNGLGRIFGGSGNFTPGSPPPRRGDDRRPAPERGDEPGRAEAQNEDEVPNPGDLDPNGGFPPFPPSDPGVGFSPFPPDGRGGGSLPEGFGPGSPPGPAGPGVGGPPGGFGGPPGVRRFANPHLAGQFAWLFPLALIGSGVAATRARWRPADQTLLTLLLWGGWLVTHWVIFSWARGIFHEYYTTVMAPALAALCGIGVTALWRQCFQGGGWRTLLLPAALLLTAVWQAFVVNSYPDERCWVLPIMLLGIAEGTVGILSARLLARLPKAIRWGKCSAGVGLATLLIAPASWSLSCLLVPSFGGMPAAGPLVRSSRPGPGPLNPFPRQLHDHTRLVKFLRANRRSERVLIAAQGSMSVAPIIIQTGEPAVALGGFMGADPAITKDEFARMVEEGELRFVLVGGGPGGGMPPFRGPPGPWFGPPGGRQPPGPPPGGPGGPANIEIIQWVREHGKAVDPDLWQAEELAEDAPLRANGVGWRPPAPIRMERLYDCRPELGLIEPEARASH